jgi:hypothetical protein
MPWRLPRCLVIGAGRPHLTRMNLLRKALLDLHQALIAEERASYERRTGQINGAAFLRVLIEDPAYAWLQPLSALIVRMDDEDADPAAIAAGTRALVRPDFTGSPFQVRYAWLIEQSPDVAYSHGVVKQALRYATAAWQEPSRSPALPAS